MAQIDLQARAKRAYERGWWITALWPAVGIVALSVTAWQLTTPTLLSMITAPLLVAACVHFMRQSRAAAQATLLGLFAGLVPFALPLVLRDTSHCCAGTACWSTCLLGCAIGGVVAGAVIGVAAVRRSASRLRFLLTAALFAGGVGSMGCMVASLSGVAVLALTLPLTSFPVVAARRLWT